MRGLLISHSEKMEIEFKMESEQPKEGMSQLIEALALVPEAHARTHPLWKALNYFCANDVTRQFSGPTTSVEFSGPFAGLQFPFHKMGNITSLHLFGLDELILFSYYWRNRHRYKRTLDLGANIGLHSIVMSNCGFDVQAYEPDPESYKVLCRNLALNKCDGVNPINAAVSTKTGVMEFVRVLDNLTGNHLVGAKTRAYGDLQTISVQVQEFAPLLREVDFAKIDVEGHEAEILLSTTRNDWQRADAIVEIGSVGNATAVYEHFKAINVGIFAQKLGWKRVTNVSDMPKNYKEGSLFVTRKSNMEWQA